MMLIERLLGPYDLTTLPCGRLRMGPGQAECPWTGGKDTLTPEALHGA